MSPDPKLVAVDAIADDQSGFPVAISGGKAIVGSRFDDDSGSVYLFDVATREQVAKLTASDAATNDLFGYAVAIAGDTAIVGSPLHDDNGSGSGSVHLYSPGKRRRSHTASRRYLAPWQSLGASDPPPPPERRVTGKALGLAAGLLAAGVSMAGVSSPRCSAMGQVSLFAWLGVLTALNQQDDGVTAPALALLSDVTTTYGNLGCDQVALAAAFDCLLEESGSAPARDLARQCLASSGLSKD